MCAQWCLPFYEGTFCPSSLSMFTMSASQQRWCLTKSTVTKIVFRHFLSIFQQLKRSKTSLHLSSSQNYVWNKRKHSARTKVYRKQLSNACHDASQFWLADQCSVDPVRWKDKITSLYKSSLASLHWVHVACLEWANASTVCMHLFQGRDCAMTKAVQESKSSFRIPVYTVV